MRWQTKAAVQNVLGIFPPGAAGRLNYLLQRWVMHSFPTSDEQFFMHFDEAAGHVLNFERHAPVSANSIESVHAYEFGAGWDLIGPLSLYALGVNGQLIVDIQALAQWELVNHILKLFSRYHGRLEERAGRPLRRLPDRPIGSASELRAHFGIDYRAPVDARSTGLEDGSFHLITSTFTLEHIPASDVRAILCECDRLLAPTGVLSCSIDMQDHYSFVDPRISVYNFLRYSDRAWRMVNSSLHYQNRLRASDYLRYFEQAGLRVVDCRITEPDAADREHLAALPIARRFATDYARADLEGKSMIVTAVRAGD